MKRSEMTKEQLRERVIRRLRKMKSQFELDISNVDAWNVRNPTRRPVDAGYERSMLMLTNNLLSAWERNDNDAVNIWQEKMNDACVRTRSTPDWLDD